RGTLDEHSIGISKSPCLETLELNDCSLAQRFLKSLFGNFGIERLSCDLETYERFSYGLFDDNEFMSIKFSRCVFNPANGAIRWDKLTFLHIERGKLVGDSIGKILSRSPCLETLELQWKPGESYIDTLEINAPYILSLKITRKMYLEKFLLENVDDIEEELLRGLLSSLGHVNDITLGDYNCLQALTRSKVKDGADGDEDGITELIDSGWKKVADDRKKVADDNWKRVAAAEKKKLEKLKRNKNLMQPRQRHEKLNRESKTEEKVLETGESNDVCLIVNPLNLDMLTDPTTHIRAPGFF
ncbi:ribonuclease H-like domain-containing protein, partial [Tanacetum coccineum]